MKWMWFFLFSSYALAQTPSIPAFRIESSDIDLKRTAEKGSPFDKCGRRAALIGDETGRIEAWVYPVKLARSCVLSFLPAGSAEILDAEKTVRTISVTPEATTITYSSTGFSVKAHFIVPWSEPGAIILLDVNSSEPLTILFSFLPVLQPMWPAGLGGQMVTWEQDVKAFVLSEPTRTYYGFIGSPAATPSSAPRGYLYSDMPNQLRIEIRKPDSIVGRFIPIVLSGGIGNRDSLRALHRTLTSAPERFYRTNLEHYRMLRSSSLQVQTPNTKLNLAFEWAKVSQDNLFVTVPALGTGLAAGLGSSGIGTRPGMGWFFGNELLLSSFGLTSYGAVDRSREALVFINRWRRSDGKLPHEIAQTTGMIDWWQKYPYGYVHAEPSPLYLCAIGDYLKFTGDSVFLADQWPQLQETFSWCKSTDINGDGLMELKSAGLGPVETGPLAEAQSDCYTNAAFIRAAEVMSKLALTVGDTVYARTASAIHQRSVVAYDNKFWDQKNEHYAYGITARGDRIDGPTPWNTLALLWSLGEPRYSLRTAVRLNAADLTTDWGVRTMSVGSKWFEPLTQGYGNVRTSLTGLTAAANFRHHFALQGYSLLLSAASHSFDNGLGITPEVFSGSYNIKPDESGSHQASAAMAIVYPLVRGVLGLDGNVGDRKVSFSPHLPPEWDRTVVSNFRLGSAIFSFEHTRSKNAVKTVVRQTGGDQFTLSYAPGIGAGSLISKVRIDGKEVPFKVIVSVQTMHPFIELKPAAQTTIEVEFTPSVEFLSPQPPSFPGEPSRGLKILSAIFREKQWKLVADGIAGSSYELFMINDDAVASVSGCERRGNKLVITFPHGREGEFLRKEILVSVK